MRAWSLLWLRRESKQRSVWVRFAFLDTFLCGERGPGGRKSNRWGGAAETVWGREPGQGRGAEGRAGKEAKPEG